MSKPGWLPQPLPMFATNIGGRDLPRLLKSGAISGSSIVGTSRLPEPLVTVMGAQFIYIS